MRILMNGFNLEYIQKLRIHELRDFARQVGVSSPTTMKKEELIEKILEIIGNESGSQEKNEKEPFDFFALLTSPDSDIINDVIAKSVVKSEGNYTDTNYLDNTLVVKKNNFINPNAPYSYPTNDFISFNFQLSQGKPTICGDISEAEGYLDIHPSGYGIIRKSGFIPTANDAYVTLALIKKYNLKKGNYVRGKAKFILENRPKIMFDIISIENDEPNENSNFDDFPYLKSTGELYLEKFEKLNIAMGERLYFSNMTIEDAVKLGYDIVDENSANVKLINLKALPEERYASHQKIQIINLPFNKTEQEALEAVELVIERAKREFEYSKSNVIMIYNFSELIRMYNVAVEGFYTFDKYNAKAMNKLSNIMCTAKFTNEKKNITLLCIDKKEIGDDVKNLFYSEFVPLFNKNYNMNDYNND